jgi:glucose 1-dehydrogenase
MKLTNQIALVTGSTQGIGLAIAERLATEGADIIINGRHESEKAQAAVATIKALGRRVHFIAADQSSVTEAQRLVTEAVAHFGRIDVLVNSAGQEKKMPFEEI